MFLSLLTYLEDCVNRLQKRVQSQPTVDRIALVQDVTRPLSRQKRMKPVLESDHPNGVSKSRLLLEEVDHLDDTVFRRRLCKVQLPVWVAEFP